MKKRKIDARMRTFMHLCPLYRKDRKRRHHHVNNSPSSFFHEFEWRNPTMVVRFMEDRINKRKKRVMPVEMTLAHFSKGWSAGEAYSWLETLEQEGRMILKTR